MTKLKMENRSVVARRWGSGVRKGGGRGYKRVVVEEIQELDCAASCDGDHTNLYLIKLHRAKHT